MTPGKYTFESIDQCWQNIDLVYMNSRLIIPIRLYNVFLAFLIFSFTVGSLDMADLLMYFVWNGSLIKSLGAKQIALILCTKFTHADEDALENS